MRKVSLDCVYELAKRDPRVVFIGSDLGAGTLRNFQKEMPDRFFMEGVSEQNIIGMAAGLAMEGYIPYVNTIATFLTRRCYEQLAVDLCLHNLPVRLIANGGGLVYAPLGPTHLAVEDMAIMRALPNMTVVAVSDAPEMARFMPQTLDWRGPVYIRLGKGGDPVISKEENGFAMGKAIMMREPGETLFIATGVMTERCLRAAEILAAKGHKAGVMHMHTVKPLDEEAVLAAAPRVQRVITVEEHTVIGGLGSAVTDLLTEKLGSDIPRIIRRGIPDRFMAKYGSQDDLLKLCGLDAESLVACAADKIALAA